jgi:hypothetical protein
LLPLPSSLGFFWKVKGHGSCRPLLFFVLFFFCIAEGDGTFFSCFFGKAEGDANCCPLLFILFCCNKKKKKATITLLLLLSFFGFF